MKKYLIPIFIFLGLIAGVAHAQVSNPNYFKLSSGNVTVLNSSWGFTVPELGGHGVVCVNVDNSGTFQVASGACGTGGASTTITILPGSGISVTTSTTSTTVGNTGVISLASSSDISVSSPTGAGILLTLVKAYLTAAIQSFNGATSSNQTAIGGTGISVSTLPGAGNSTTTITNTGVTSYNGATSTINSNVVGSGNVTTTVAKSGGNSTTTVSLTNSGVASGTYTCVTETVASSGYISMASSGTCLTTAITSINNATSGPQTIVGGTGESVATVAGATNSTTTVTNTGVTSFTGANCVTAANTTGTISLTVTCLSGNQTITFVMTGDATGTASGTTSITDSIKVTGLNGVVLPANTTGTLQFTSSSWRINLATSSLGQFDANGKLSSFTGSSYNPSPSCVTSVSISGAGALSGTSGACSGGSGSSTPQLPTIIVSSQTGANYPSSSLAAAITAANSTTTYPNGALIWLPDANYTVTSTLQLANHIQIIGNGPTQTTINIQATSTGSLNSPGSVLFTRVATIKSPLGIGIHGLLLNQTSGTFSGSAINWSNWTYANVTDIRTVGFRYMLYANDTQSPIGTAPTLYDHFADMTSFDDSGVYISSTEPVNDNYFERINTAPNQSGGAGPYYGLYLNDGQGNNFQNFNAEAGTQAHTTGIALVDGASAGNTDSNNFTGSWLEGDASATDIGSGVLRTSFISGVWDTDTSYLNDRGTDTSLFCVNINFGSCANQFGASGLTVGGNVTSTSGHVTGALQVGGALTDKDGNKYSTSTASVAGSGTVSTSTGLTSGSITLNTGTSTIGNSSLSQSGGTTYINGTTPVLDGGGNVLANIIQPSGANVIIQAPTSTASVGNLNQSGGVQTYNTTTTLTGAQFLGGGYINIQNTTNSITLILPTTSTIYAAAATAGASIWTSGFSTQFIGNNSTNTVFSVTSGTGEIQLYSPGTPTSLAPGQEWMVTGQFEGSSTILASTSNQNILAIKYTLYQTSTISTPIVLASNGATTTVSSSKGNSTTTVSLLLGSYLGLDASGNATASSTLASSSVSFLFYNATTTAPAYEDLITTTKKTITKVDCFEAAAATTTIELYYNTTLASSGIQQVILSSLACGVNGTSTTSFTTTTLPIASYLFAIINSTAGTPQLTTVNVQATKL